MKKDQTYKKEQKKNKTNNQNPSSKTDKKDSGKTVDGVLMLTRKGVGYLACQELEKDILIPQKDLHTAFHNDTVRVKLYRKPQDQQQAKGKVIKVLERSKLEFVGVIKKKGENAFLELDSPRIHTQIKLNQSESKQVRGGVKALVKLKPWNEPKKMPRGALVEILGPEGEHETEMHAIVLEYNFRTSFPKAVQKQADQIKSEKTITNKDKQERRDMRDRTTMTIDPESAKDYDDALSIYRNKDGSLEVGVHIADVSRYVPVGSPIDQEAFKRGTSVYLVDRTIPMLPEVLSNDVCSLNPGEDKLAFSAIFTITKDGEISKEWFGRTIINSDKRFTYEEAQNILDTGSGELHDELYSLNELSQNLRKERMDAGAIAFGSEDITFELDENGAPLAVHRKPTMETNQLVEELMLLANRRVAAHINKKEKQPVFIYRIHEQPDSEKLEELSTFVRAIGYDLKSKGEEITSMDLNKLFEQIEGTPEEDLVKLASVRAMAKAVYSTNNLGHFGLSFEYYTHFTSPIRRYPDLAVHRLLQKQLQGKKISEEDLEQYKNVAIQASEREAAAVNAERASIKYKQVEYLKNYIGEEFTGSITGVTDWGIYIQEDHTKADGMMPLSLMKDDFYVLDEKNYRLRGRKTHTTYSIGDRVRIKLISANLEERKVEFQILEKMDK